MKMILALDCAALIDQGVLPQGTIVEGRDFASAVLDHTIERFSQEDLTRTPPFWGLSGVHGFSNIYYFHTVGAYPLDEYFKPLNGPSPTACRVVERFGDVLAFPDGTPINASADARIKALQASVARWRRDVLEEQLHDA